MPPSFTLIVVATADGFIARHPGHSPASWASAEEQSVFLAEVDFADWSIMGRGTHQAADRPDRRRIVFSTAAPVPDWRRPTQVWLDPANLSPDALPALVDNRHSLQRAVVLGGTRVHDWFLAAGRIDRVLLTVEPLTFGAGLPMFTGAWGDPVASLMARGFVVAHETALNPTGTRLITLFPD